MSATAIGTYIRNEIIKLIATFKLNVMSKFVRDLDVKLLLLFLPVFPPIAKPAPRISTLKLDMEPVGSATGKNQIGFGCFLTSLT